MIIKVRSFANVMLDSQLPLTIQTLALILMNVLKIPMSVVIMPTALTMKVVSPVIATMALKLVLLILSPALMLMNVLLVLALIPVKTLLARLPVRVPMVLFSAVTVPAVMISMNVPMTPLVTSMLIAVTCLVLSSVHAKEDLMVMESPAKMLTNVPTLTPVLPMQNATILLVPLSALAWMALEGVSSVIT